MRLASALLAAALLATSAAAEDLAVPVVRPIAVRLPRYLETTGSIAAMQSIDLMARVSGTLEGIEAADGALVAKGAILFVIEPRPYESKLRQAQAAEEQQRALGAQAAAEYSRQAQLRSSSASSQSTLDSALATRDSSNAALKQAEEATTQAAITYAYTRVLAPFDGIMTAHLVSVGELVGFGSPTKLATLMQLDPIWANAAISEGEILRIRTALATRGKTVRDLGPVPVEAALAGEQGYPHHGTLDYVAPQVDPATGTLAVRARFDNPGNALLPGYFVRMRIRLATDEDAFLVPHDAVASDQGTPTVLVLGADGTVRQQKVRLGGTQNGMQVIDEGVTAQDRVLASADTLIEPGARIRAIEQPPGPAATPSAATPGPAGKP